MESDTNNVRKKSSRLNVDIPEDLFTRLNIYCAKENMYKKDIVPLAIENFLDEMEGSKN